jgi:AraC-like DNA-binding protein
MHLPINKNTMMESRTLYIENMVCPRCTTAVTKVLTDLGWDIDVVELGKVIGAPPANWSGDEQLKQQLEKIGFGLAEEGSVVGQLKGVIIDYVYKESRWPSQVLSDVLTAELDLSYGHLSRSFSEEAGRTIEDYYQSHRTERARRLLHHTKFPIAEIATLLRYGTAAYFSNSFRQHTGQSPSTFRKTGKYVPVDLTQI